MQKLIEKYFAVGHDVSATIIISLLVFISGYFASWVVKKIGEYGLRKANRKLFFENIKSLNRSLRKQERGFSRTISSLLVMSEEPWQYYKVDFFQLSVFREISYKDTFEAFFSGMENIFFVSWSKKIRKLRRRAFNKFWEHINTIEFYNEQAKETFLSNLEKYNLDGEKRNICINSLRQFWEKLFQYNPNEITTSENKYLNTLFLIIQDFKNIPTRSRVNPYITQRKLVLRIRILNKRFHDLSFIREFTDVALAASHHYTNMENIVRHTKSQFEIYRESFRLISRVNEKIIELLKK